MEIYRAAVTDETEVDAVITLRNFVVFNVERNIAAEEVAAVVVPVADEEAVVPPAALVAEVSELAVSLVLLFVAPLSLVAAVPSPATVVVFVNVVVAAAAALAA